MLSSQCRGILLSKSTAGGGASGGRRLLVRPRRPFTNNIPESMSATLVSSSTTTTEFNFSPYGGQTRSFSNDIFGPNGTTRIGKYYGKHKDVHSPFPPPFKGHLVVEPPVRSRPYRPGGSSGGGRPRPTVTSAATKPSAASASSATSGKMTGNKRTTNSTTPRTSRPRSPPPPNRRMMPKSKINDIMDKEVFGSAPVQAVHAAQTIDLASVVSKVFMKPGMKKMMERLSVVVQLPTTTPSQSPNDHNIDGTNYQHHPSYPSYHDYSHNKPAKFVAVFRFGSVVFFNVPPREAADLLHSIKKHSREPVASGFERKENFCVHIQSNFYELLHQQQQQHQQMLQQQHEGGDVQDATTAGGGNVHYQTPRIVTGEYCVVQDLNMKSVDVISNVIAQSVALDAYNDTVDELLSTFSAINSTVKTAGSLTSVQRDSLFRTVASNNAIFIDMVSKLGIKDRSDTAWNLSQYEDIHYGLQSEFEIQLRFEHIEFKLDLIQQNAKFFLEVLQSQKSNSLEWIIIVLIGFECILMCLDMSGVGASIFSPLVGGSDTDAAAAAATTTISAAGGDLLSISGGAVESTKTNVIATCTEIQASAPGETTIPAKPAAGK